MVAEAYERAAGAVRIHGGWSFFPVYGDPEWQALPAEDREQIHRLWEAVRTEPYPMRTLTGFLDFVRSGSRKSDETPYFFRRRKLCTAVLACLTREDNLDEVLDGIWCICEESTWVISAHNVNPIPGAPAAAERPIPDENWEYIDLFAAQTGMILALVSNLLADPLDGVTPLLRKRIHAELERRILRPFLAHDEFWWMGISRQDLCNWTPWILSNILMTACTEVTDGDRLSRILWRAAGMLDRWLAVVPEDGGCDEGVGYWNMAGGAFLDCLELYETVTGGQMRLYGEPKVRNILSFPKKAEIGEGWFINFADCDARPLLSGERIETAGERLGDEELRALGQRIRNQAGDDLLDVPHFSRVLRRLFHPAREPAVTGTRSDVWLPDLQVRVVRRGGMTLAVKGGHNGESHNHNDVGSFILFDDGKPLIIDAGNMTYTARTFSEERYTLWNVRSLYHNVPIIGGCEQLAGRQYRAGRVQAVTNGLTLGLEAAYGPEAELQRYDRRCELDKDMLVICDRLTLNRAQPVRWVFMLREKPTLGDGRITTASMRMRFPEGMRATAEEIPITDSRMAQSFPGSLYRVMILADGTELEAKFTVGRLDRDE
ncbi:MAG: heparinase II/III family protein [Clostridia bacterium]|nr:heparinase II/III family protein [Clostridia bacterium]